MDQDPYSTDEFRLMDLIDIPTFKNTLDSFAKLTGIAVAILELDGEVLVASGWQEICTEFHRKHAVTARRCRESDTALSGQLEEGKKYNVYKCKNGLVDIAVPIVIEGTHIGNLFAGQFFFESPDIDFFSTQAELYGFDSFPNPSSTACRASCTSSTSWENSNAGTKILN